MSQVLDQDPVRAFITSEMHHLLLPSRVPINCRSPTYAPLPNVRKKILHGRGPSSSQKIRNKIQTRSCFVMVSLFFLPCNQPSLLSDAPPYIHTRIIALLLYTESGRLASKIDGRQHAHKAITEQTTIREEGEYNLRKLKKQLCCDRVKPVSPDLLPPPRTTYVRLR